MSAATGGARKVFEQPDARWRAGVAVSLLCFLWLLNLEGVLLVLQRIW